ncbi:hypothetical protein [Phytohabitans houttuyneae]|uniref:Uncharacterized protein n=1 Tax=Phytohabitans houttuyneae TaxID=1076126 RepID=A0A6V8KKP4_9ACTN|nr:hypothetical protein [Phytohabitans houttuyneae]GFJ81255.1 hypothetical protein Phou_054350 [Phytohabitans houttuyneae]
MTQAETLVPVEAGGRTVYLAASGGAARPGAEVEIAARRPTLDRGGVPGRPVRERRPPAHDLCPRVRLPDALTLLAAVGSGGVSADDLVDRLIADADRHDRTP